VGLLISIFGGIFFPKIERIYESVVEWIEKHLISKATETKAELGQAEAV